MNQFKTSAELRELQNVNIASFCGEAAAMYIPLTEAYERSESMNALLKHDIQSANNKFCKHHASAGSLPPVLAGMFQCPACERDQLKEQLSIAREALERVSKCKPHLHKVGSGVYCQIIAEQALATLTK